MAKQTKTSRSGSGGAASYRARHRKAQHDAAHADGHGDTHPPIITHALVPQGEAELIETSAGLAELIGVLREAGVFAYDSEFIGEQSYHAKLCVIQVGTGDRIWLVDALAIAQESSEALRGFWELIADASVTKLVHAGDQDLEPVVRLIDQAPAGIVDTQILAAFAGYRYPIGLAKLCEDLLNADMGRGLKFSQWDERPLSSIQRWYAANDVRYLPLLYERLLARVEACGNSAWAREACGALEDVTRYRTDPHTRRLNGKGALNGRERAVVKRLIDWRETAAQEADLPPRTLVGDGVLLELSRERPETMEAMEAIRGLPRPVKRDAGPALLAEIAAAKSDPLVKKEGISRFDEERLKPQVQAWWSAVQARCEEQQVDVTLVLAKRDLLSFAYEMDRAEKTGEAVTGHKLQVGWRGELLAGVFDPPANEEDEPEG